VTVIFDAPVFAFELADGRPEWPEIVLALGAAFLVAYGIMLLVRRLLRWILEGVTGGEHPHPGAALQQSLFGAQLLIFLITWVAFSIVVLDAIGLPVDVGLGRGALRGWLLASGLRIALILVIGWLVLRVASIATTRLERGLITGEGPDVIERTKRAQTIGRLVRNVLAVLVTLIALLMVLRELGMDIVPMLTGAGIAGVALGFGAQWLVRDIIAGFFLILENQVRVGDVAAINGVGGVVEAITLRTIVLRDGEGTVHVFPNGAINTLANRSKEYAYYMIDLAVPYDQDPDKVMAVLRRVGEKLAADPAYAPLILAPLEIFGVDAFLDTKATIKLRIKTAPLKQWDVGRELRRRIMHAFEQHGIPLHQAPMPLYIAGERPKET
jgi:small conductance mechanosensitive channel